jgi:multiple sugar transport system ATP-binding protein
VFQNIALFPHMDVYDNISFGLRLRNFPKEEMDERVDEAARVVRMQGMLDRMPSEMSGGQRQRVAIARAIVRDPDVFLMDEPLANLDAKLRVNMRTELQRLHKQLDTTIIYVTHNQAEAMTMSDRIAVLDAGELQQIAAPLTCYNEPTNLFVAGFIGSPSMNFLNGTVPANEIKTPNFSIEFDSSTIDGLASGDDVTIGVRPEDVYPTAVSGDVSHPTAPIQARSDVLEPMGDEIFAYLLLGEGETSMSQEAATDDQLLMSIEPDSDLQEEEDVEVVLDRRKIHLFDDATGDALAHGIVDLTGDGASGTRAETDD